MRTESVWRMGYDLLPGEPSGLLRPEVEVGRYHVTVWHPTHKCRVWLIPEDAHTVRLLVDAELTRPGTVLHCALADAILEYTEDPAAVFAASAIARHRIG